MCDNGELWLESKAESVKEFFSQLYVQKYTIADMLSGLQDKTLMDRILFFSVGIEYNDKFCIFNKDKNEWEKPIDLDTSDSPMKKYQMKMFQIENIFQRQTTREYGNGVCRCIGGVKKEKAIPSGEYLKISVYYYVAVNDSGLDLTFLQCAEREYSEWISYELAASLNSANHKETLSEKTYDTEIKMLNKKISETFPKYMYDILGIEIDVITALSSIYYEGTPCHSDLVFSISDSDIHSPKKLKGITLKDPLTVSTKNVKRIRKLLEMGQQGQCLLVCKDTEGWQVRGLYKTGDLCSHNITFRIMGHMIWSMEVGGKLSACYKCGEYAIENKEFELEKLKKKYEETFGEDIKDNVKKIFVEVMGQKHGAILIIIKKTSTNKSAKAEVNRLIKDSTGIEIEPCDMPENFTNSITSVDGALIIDECGRCYGFGMILDSETKLSGNPERGARYNSTRRYIKTCKENSINAIGVVVSEDKMIDIFSTKDDFGEEGEKRWKRWKRWERWKKWERRKRRKRNRILK